MDYQLYSDVPIPGSPALIDFYIPHSHSLSTPLVLYFHGGAWRTGSKTDESSTFLAGLANRGFSVASVGYQLTPHVTHPVHHNDCVAALEYVSQSPSSFPFVSQAWNPANVILAGYSAGAFQVGRLCLDTKDQTDGLTPNVKAPSETAVNSLRGAICIDGIYDLHALIEEYPNYDFVQQAFGEDTYDAYSRISPATATGAKRLVPWLVLQSPDDELLSIRQSHEFMQFINLLGHPVHQDYISGTHYELIHRPGLVDVVTKFITQLHH